VFFIAPSSHQLDSSGRSDRLIRVTIPSQARFPVLLAFITTTFEFMFSIHTGRSCFGKTPMQTFLDAMPMTKEKMIAA
jgi:hypothetical protein